MTITPPSTSPRATWKRSVAVALLFLVFAGGARAQVAVSGAWARATAPGQDSGVVYLTITPRAPDRLVKLASPAAASVMLHRTTQQGGMSGMADMDGLTVPAGRSVQLAPHGMHIMLMGLRHPLAAGGSVGLDLTFATAGVVHVQVPVQPIGAVGPPG